MDTNTFELSDMVIWTSDPNRSRMTELCSASHGNGPFEVFEIKNISKPSMKKIIGHHQWVALTYSCNTLLDHTGKTQLFSGVLLKKIKK